jgi:plastocyanin
MKRAMPVWMIVAMAVYANAAHAGELRARALDQEGRAVEDAVVMAKPVSAAGSLQPQRREEIVDQVHKEFIPYVMPVLVGSRVRFPNHDNVRHDVYSFSAAKKFELPLYAGSPAAPVLFDKAGIVILGCNIHDWMVGYIYVADTPHFGKTAKDGIVALKDVPAGDYDVRIWQPRMNGTEDSTVKRITIRSAAVSEVEWKLTLKPAFRIPRIPALQGGRYR